MAEKDEMWRSAWTRGPTGVSGVQPLGNREDYRDLGGYGQSEEGPFVGVGPRGWVRSNRAIHRDLCRKMAAEGYLDASNIEIEVQDGIVTLLGRVSSPAQRTIAEQLAERTGGVRGVQNHIQLWGRGRRLAGPLRRRGSQARGEEEVHERLPGPDRIGPPQYAEERRRYERSLYGPPRSARRGVATPEGSRIVREVMERLADHGLDAFNIRVGCRGGEVILRGMVEDREQKRLAEELADEVSGVRDVHNRLRIAWNA